MRIIVTITIMLLTHFNFAQVGIRAGVNYSDFSISGADTYWGYELGITHKNKISDGVQIESELIYSINGYKLLNDTYRIEYANVPLMVCFNISGESFSFLIGPQFGLLLSATEKSPENNKSISSDFNNLNLGMVGGIKFPVSNTFSVGFRYIYGFTDVYRSPEFFYESSKSRIASFTIHMSLEK